MFKINSFFYRRLNNHAEMSKALLQLFLYVSVPYIMRKQTFEFLMKISICRNKALVVLSCYMCQVWGRQSTWLSLPTPWGLPCFCHSPGPLVCPWSHQSLPQWCDSRAMGPTVRSTCRPMSHPGLGSPRSQGGAWCPGLGLPCSCAGLLGQALVASPCSNGKHSWGISIAFGPRETPARAFLWQSDVSIITPTSH